MNAPERHQLITALVTAVTALFLIAGLPQFARWRLVMRRAVIVGYLCALGLALVEVAVWLSSGTR